jgi:hypothetical protein
MNKVVFYVSQEVLFGQVACKYCFDTKFKGYKALKKHFKFECCVKKCNKKNCNCFYCDTVLEILEDDGYNVYLNKNTIHTYFENGPTHFWNITSPRYVVKDVNGVFTYSSEAPADGA